MVFEEKEIKSKTIWIIDIWTYKIRCAICEFKNADFKLLWYFEKRQNHKDIVWWEIQDIKSLCLNLKDCIKKAEEKSNSKIKDLVINTSFDEVFFFFDKVNFRRKDKLEEIKKEELDKIIKKLEFISTNSSYKDLKNKYLLNKEDLQLIISSISRIKIDKKDSHKIIWKIWENINLWVLNIFIKTNTYNDILYIWNVIWKKIIKILPCEYSITRLFKKEDLVIVDIWRSHVSIIIKKWNDVIWASKLDIWIDNLIREIQKTHKVPQIDIIKNIDIDLYDKEKEIFLDVFKDCLAAWIEEIIGDNICPSKFYILWWWWNKFIKDFFSKLKLSKHNIKILSDIELVEPIIPYLKELNSKSNINIISMIVAMIDIIKKEKDPISISLENALREIEESQ